MDLFKKSSLFLTGLTAVSLFFAACGTDDSNVGNGTDDNGGDDNGSTGVENGEPTGDSDLVIAVQSEPVSLDPHGSNDTASSNVAYNIYESLILQDENMELQPLLATDWEMVDDLTWEFTLREGVTFHDGEEFNAEVVKMNFDRVLDDAVASPRSFLYEMVEEVNVVNDYTVQFVTEFPFGPLPAHIAHNGGGMMSPAIIEADYAGMDDGDEPGTYINTNPVGTGPFAFESWTSGDNVVLNKNDDYWDGAPALDSITFRVISDGQVRLADAETGNIHISGSLSPTDIPRVESADGLHVSMQDGVNMNYVGFNAQKEPFDTKEVRQALSMAIDRDYIIENVYEGLGIQAIGPIAPDVFGYDPDVTGIEYDPEQAEALLAEAGFEDGFSTTLWTNDDQERMDMATIIQNQLEQIGVDVEIEIVEWGAYLENTAAGEHDMFILGWTTVTGDADYGMYPLFHSANFGDPGNRSFFATDELDELLSDARQSADEDERLSLYSQAQEILVDEAPMMYLNHGTYLTTVSDNVNGFSTHPTNMMLLKDVTLD